MSDSQAYQRVKNTRRSDGLIWLTTNQLRELADALDAISANGASFRMGKVGTERTVEILPFRAGADLDTTAMPVRTLFADAAGITGNLVVDLKRLPGSTSPYILDIDNNRTGGGGGNQKTPPP